MATVGELVLVQAPSSKQRLPKRRFMISTRVGLVGKLIWLILDQRAKFKYWAVLPAACAVGYISRCDAPA
jgi:hypothetical protein